MVEESRIGVYICHCGLNIAGTVDVKAVAEFAKTLPSVIVARDYKYICSDPGQEIIKKDIKEHNLTRVVVASCSPRMHEPTFRKLLEESGLNPYLFEMVNIREHVSWVHTQEPSKATQKAKELVSMAVARSRLLEPLETKEVPALKSVLVIGGGIAGIQAALDLAEQEYKVFLVERQPTVGGHMAQLDKTFPTLDCSICIFGPRMVDVSRHPNIQLLTYSEVENVAGRPGDFRVRVKKKARFIDLKKCTGCSECANVCPVEIKNEFNLGLNMRKAIYRDFPQAVPAAFVIDKRGTPKCCATCPAGINVQGYIALISQGKFAEALALIKQAVPFPGVLGRVCFRPCEAECERGKVDESVAITALKRFVSDYELKNEKKKKVAPIPKTHTEKIAVIGSGPSGLTAAYELVKMGYPVTVLESLPKPGGMLRVGIPEYRLPKEVLDAEIEHIKDLGVEIRTNVSIGKDLMFNELLQEYDAAFIASGMHKGAKLGIDGEELKGVVNAIDFLREVNLGKKVELGDRVAVICVHRLLALDATRVALRLGPKEVNVIYRRSRQSMLHHKRIREQLQKEIEETEREGANIHVMMWPTKILGKDGRVVGIECAQMTLGEPDESGRRRLVPIKGSEFIMELDAVIIAVGQAPDVSFLPEEVELTEKNTIKVDPVTLETSLPGVFAGGEVESGPSTAIASIATGKRAAVSIDRYLRGADLRVGREKEIKLVEEVSKEGVEKKARQVMPILPVEKRIRGFDEIETGFTEEMALQEAERCLKCGGCSECLQCETVCEADCIIHDQKDEYVDLEVGAIIVATGFEPFDAREKGEYGYGKFDNVITSLEFERLINASGPTSGELKRPSDGGPPKRIAFIQCVGSRDERTGNVYCSNICCMSAIKQSVLIKEKHPDCEIYIFYNDIRAFGKGFEEFYRRARDSWVNFVKGIPAELVEDPETKNLTVRVADLVLGKMVEVDFDMVILSIGLVPSKGIEDLTRILRISRGSDGFLLETHPKLRPVDTPTLGVFIAGACQGPKDIPTSVVQAKAAASSVGTLLSKGKIRTESSIAVVSEELCSGCEICVILCNYDAIQMVEKNGKLVASVSEVTCTGCGVCVAACPTKSISLRHFTDQQILAQIRALPLERQFL